MGKQVNRDLSGFTQDRADDHNFEQLSLSEIHKVYINGKISKWLGEGMYRRISLSPDGNYVLITQIKKPFSYLVTYGRFPSRTDVYMDFINCYKLIKSPLIEELPKGFMSVTAGRRNFSWRADKPSTIF